MLDYQAQSIISFGPSCLSAEILKSCNQRTATYGFDWFRSGSLHHASFIRYPTEEFLQHYVFRPSLPLFQKTNPLELESKTAELEKKLHYTAMMFFIIHTGRTIMRLISILKGHF